MKTVEKIIMIVFFCGACFTVGAILGQKYTVEHFDTHQCVSVCIEEFEKMGC